MVTRLSQRARERDLLDFGVLESPVAGDAIMVISDRLQSLVQHDPLQVLTTPKRCAAYFPQSGRGDELLQTAPGEAQLSDALESAPLSELRTPQVSALGKGSTTDLLQRRREGHAPYLCATENSAAVDVQLIFKFSELLQALVQDGGPQRLGPKRVARRFPDCARAILLSSSVPETKSSGCGRLVSLLCRYATALPYAVRLRRLTAVPGTITATPSAHLYAVRTPTHLLPWVSAGAAPLPVSYPLGWECVFH